MAISIIFILFGVVGLLVYLIPFIRTFSWQQCEAEIIDNRIEIVDMGRNGIHKFEYPEYEYQHENDWFRYTQRKLVKWSPFKIYTSMTENPTYKYELNSKIRILFNKQKPNHSFILPNYLHIKFIFSTTLLCLGALLCQKS
jgi:hypothetical protein